LLDFTEIPDWVCWLAQDADGTWWGYSVEPNQSHNGWYENEVGDAVKLAKTASYPYWKETLRKVK
jgi:hypothetical protein